MQSQAGQSLIGLMSGTSLDGVDGVVASLGAQGQWQGVLAHVYQPFDDALRAELLALNQLGSDELHRAALAAQGVSRAYAAVVARLRALLADVAGTSSNPAPLAPRAPLAIGAHGQTVRHRPDQGYTLQLLAPALLAEHTGIDVVADFRSRDIAAGGQGAPLVPLFHQVVFGRTDACVAVLNLGGMSNVTLLQPGQDPLGFDCGPGNVLMDLWCQRHTGHAYDADGHWAASGRVLQPALDAALADPYFALQPPKSTGRDQFHAGWLQQWLHTIDAESALAQDIQATLCELTARTCADAIMAFGPKSQEVVVCGGGAYNGHLLRRLQAYLPHAEVMTSDQRRLPPNQVEAAAFAWLAWTTINRVSGNVPAATGAAGPRILGAVYPGSA